MDQNKIRSLWERLQTIRSEEVAVDGEVPETVRLLRREFASSTEENTLIPISTLLCGEYGRYGMNDELERHLIDMADRFSEDPMTQITLTEFYLFQTTDLPKAGTLADRALRLAIAKGRFVRHALHAQARIAKLSEDYELLTDVLKKLVAYEASSVSRDVGFEDDFLRDLPADVIPEDLLSSFYATKTP